MTSSAQSSISQDDQFNQVDRVPTPLPPPFGYSHALSINDLPLDWQYESAVSDVEAIIAQIEAGDLELADIFEQFGVAVKHLQDCEAFLNHHRQQVDILVETLTDQESG